MLIKEINRQYDRDKTLKDDSETEISIENRLSSMVNKHIDDYFECIGRIAADTSKNEIFKYSLERTISDKIQKEIDLMQLFSHLYIQVKSTLGKSKEWFEYNYIEVKMTPCHFLEECISEKTIQRLQIPFGSILDEYELKFGNNTDHGIASANYASSVFSCYRYAIKLAKAKQECLLLSILLDIPDSIEKSQVGYIDNYNHIFEAVLYAVYIHNLKPMNFLEESNGKQFRTNMNEPFAYLAILCDELQDWNRPKSLHPALMEQRPILKASEEYNVDVIETGIVLTDTATKSPEWIDEKIQELPEKLANISAYLKHRY